MSVTHVQATPPGTRDVFVAALREETTTWLFVVKSLLAFYITGWLAMRLALPQPSTAMLTTIIVANRQTGMVLAKSFYRAIGTMVGALAGFLIVAFFPQERVLFLTALSLWIGVCAGGATLYRNFKSYSFVLAGYTAAIVALPVINNPLEVFNTVVWRLSEVLLGIGVSAAVSDIVFPSRIRDDLRRLCRAQFANFIDFVQRAVCGKVARADLENAHLRFVRDAVAVEDLRSSVIFEDPEARARSGHMLLLNQRFMATSTTLQTLHHLINRLKRKGHEVAADALIELYRPLAGALDAPIEAGAAARVLLPRLDDARQAISERKGALRANMSSAYDMLDFDTGATLVDRFVDELYAYVETASQLQAPRLFGSVTERVRFERGNDYFGSALTMVRTSLVMGVLSFYWIVSAWPSGASAMLLATVFAGLFAAAPNPAQWVLHTSLGFVLGTCASFICLFFVLPLMDGFGLFVAGSAPFLMIGLAMITWPVTARAGVGYCMGFTLTIAVRNEMSYDVVFFWNDTLAQYIGLAATGMAFLLLPPAIGSLWFRRRQLEKLRRQVRLAASAPLPGLRARFESMNHDLFGQIVSQTERGSQASRHLVAWTLSVNEVGRTLIELRSDMAGRPLPEEVREAIERTIDAIAQLYEHPDTAAYIYARDAVAATTAMIEGDEAMGLLLNHLNVLRLAMLDEQSVLAAYMQAHPPAQGVAHAA
ncbi:FUSC family protein [Dyella nitratireducens]|uniref:Fusaric acid resistance protein n=1 Tax=Dyella nitratireducens TaxID=1849580 RepID=A0ABQ1G6S3_9GAMM|nr:FUSC family protein [Dyella nitratireducens]GGA37856.1 fusaric acid resistance protein [Dyella nitratireducens]GLQ40236.1 fusaric acid resistance protein [Dyella nitratireducens]